MPKRSFHKAILICSRLSATEAARYPCFESVPDGYFAVQRADFA